MENQKDLELNDLAIGTLKESTKWTILVCVAGFVVVGFLIIMAVLLFATMALIPRLYIVTGNPGKDAFFFSMFGNLMYFWPTLFTVLAIIFSFPLVYLYKYAKKLRMALEFKNADMLTASFVNFKSHHKFLGIMAVVILTPVFLYLFMVIIMMLAFLARGLQQM